MFPGDRYKLGTCLIPAESIIECVSTPNCHKGMVDMLWVGEPLTMFVHEVDCPGTKIAEPQPLDSVEQA